MENLSMCRICLATDVRLCSIASHLRDMYERITSMTFKKEEWRPLVACYICIARLQNCYRLRTSCLRSEELLTEMMSRSEIKPQDVLSTNTFRVVSVLHLSIVVVKEEASEIIHDAELDQQYAKDAEYINLEEHRWEPDIAGPSLQPANNICPKVVKVVLERIDLYDTRIGARVSKKIAALKDTEDATTHNRKIDVIKNEQTETITIEEPNIVTKNIVKNPVTASRILETCDKVDINVNKCDSNVLTSIVNDVCEGKSANDTSLEQNVSSVSSNKAYQCNVCKKCFIKNFHLKMHSRIHISEKPYQCNVCNKCFRYKHHLKDHILTHTGEKLYRCNICKISFNLKSNLKTHIRIHTGDKPYQCNVCTKCFTQKVSLQTHIRTHTGDKPYQCNVCKKSYTQKVSLQTHIRIHTGDKPYQCNFCKKCFTQKVSLQIHIRTHTGNKPYQCNVCNKRFRHSGSYSKHMCIHKR